MVTRRSASPPPQSGEMQFPLGKILSETPL
jgi:hypothetical protein